MKRLALLAAVLAAMPVLADRDDGPIRARLSGLQEVPVVLTNASGEFEARIANDGASITYELTYSGLQGQVRQAHIHVAQRNVNGAIVLWLCGSTQNPGPAGTQVCPQTGRVSGTLVAANVQAGGAQQVADLADVIDALRAGAGYVNVHTDLSPGGEIRGQLGGRGNSLGHGHSH
jgi:hypothetical protein